MTHTDLEPPPSSSSSSSEQTSDAELYEQLMKQHATNVIVEPHIFRLDSNQAMGAEMKLLRQTIAAYKKQIVQVRTSDVYTM